jgi:SAM-dependent methyltransferase
VEGAHRADEPRDRGANLSDAAARWSGADYERVAETFAPVHDRIVDGLSLRAGDRVLDVATGTGGVALRAARAGAEVVGVDISADQLSKARAAADAEGIPLELIECDCQEMPLPDESFDAAASAFGLIFAPDHARAGAELARVCKPGARIAVTAWTFDAFSETAERVGRPASPGEDPRLWSGEEHARGSLPAFDLRFETGTWRVQEASADAVWELLATSVPPIKLWLAEQDEATREAAKHAYSEVFPDGVLERQYVLILGTRL